jgi:hypothetical protein
MQTPKPRVRTRAPKPPAPRVRVREARPTNLGPYPRFAKGGAPGADFLRAGTGNNSEAGFIVPGKGGGNRGAYLQKKDGTREFLGYAPNWKAAHRMIVGSLGKRTRTRKPAS